MTVVQLAPRATSNAPPRLRNRLSLKEVVVLADVPERPVRKDIEIGLLHEPRLRRLDDGRIWFEWLCVFTVAAVYGNRWLSSEMRKSAITKIEDMCKKSIEPDWWASPTRFINWNCSEHPERRSIAIDRYVTLDLFTACHNVVPRMGIYANGLARIEEREDVLGGDAVFKRSRLPVNHVGKMFESGETMENILEDYPYLNEDDVRFASLYYRAHPTTGRPRKSGESNDNASVDVG